MIHTNFKPLYLAPGRKQREGVAILICRQTAWSARGREDRQHAVPACGPEAYPPLAGVRAGVRPDQQQRWLAVAGGSTPLHPHPRFSSLSGLIAWPGRGGAGARETNNSAQSLETRRNAAARPRRRRPAGAALLIFGFFDGSPPRAPGRALRAAPSHFVPFREEDKSSARRIRQCRACASAYAATGLVPAAMPPPRRRHAARRGA